MDKQGFELSLLATFSALLCGVAFYHDNLIATAVFAGLTCATGMIAMDLRRVW